MRDEGELLVIGLDEFGQKMAAEIVFIQLPPEGKRLKRGKSFTKMESGKWLGKIIAPVDGEIEEVNEDIEINQDCYGQAWMYKVRGRPASRA